MQNGVSLDTVLIQLGRPKQTMLAVWRTAKVVTVIAPGLNIALLMTGDAVKSALKPHALPLPAEL